MISAYSKPVPIQVVTGGMLTAFVQFPAQELLYTATRHGVIIIDYSFLSYRNRNRLNRPKMKCNRNRLHCQFNRNRRLLHD